MIILIPDFSRRVFGPSIEHAQRDERTGLKRDVWLLGEVDILRPANRAAAERLEELGNEVIREYSIKILCACSVSRGPPSEVLIMML
jgi:hypothetical protein